MQKAEVSIRTSAFFVLWGIEALDVLEALEVLVALASLDFLEVLDPLEFLASIVLQVVLVDAFSLPFILFVVYKGGILQINFVFRTLIRIFATYLYNIYSSQCYRIVLIGG